MGPIGEERIGDVSNVLFTNGWIADEDGKVFIYYASSDTRMHVATSTVEKLVDYCLNSPADGYRSAASVETLKKQIAKNLAILKKKKNKSMTLNINYIAYFWIIRCCYTIDSYRRPRIGIIPSRTRIFPTRPPLIRRGICHHPT